MKDEITKLIGKKMDILRRSAQFIGYGKLVNYSTLERIGEKFGIKKVEEIFNDVELINIILSSHQVIPKFLIDFISLFEDDLKPKSIFDPCVTKQSYAIQNNTNSFGYCKNIEEYKVLTKIFNIDESHIKLGDNIKLLREEKRKFDFIVSFPPFNVQANNIKDSKSNDFATNLLIESSFILKPNGFLGFLMSSKFAFDKKVKNDLKSNGLYINGLFYLPEGSLLPATSIGSYFIIASRNKINQTFVAKLSEDNQINKIIFNNYKKNINGKTLQLGRLVNFDDFISYKSFENKEELLKLGKRTGNSSLKLGDISTIQTIKDIKPENVEHKINSIYIPKVGNSKVVDSPKDFNIKSKNYLQVILNSEYANSTYLSNYFNTHIGRLSIESCKVGVAIESLSKNSLQNCTLFIPSLNNQLEVINVNQQIEKYSQELSALQDKLWRNPKGYKEVNKVIKKYIKEENIINWLDNLPFPLSSILWKYQATTDNKEKIEHLLHFFEGFSEFTALIMLSAYSQNEEFYKRESHRWTKNDPNHSDWIKKATFGGWNYLTANLSKATRTFLNDKEQSEIVKSLFGNPSQEFFDFITNKGIFNILNEVREYRNKWKGHGGVAGKQENKNRLTILEQKLTELRSIIKDGFINFRLISSGSCLLEDGINICNVRELIGTRTPFNETKIKSIFQLDSKKLYFMFIGKEKPIELLPFIKYNQENKACYFYSSIESNGIRWISFHYEKNSEINEEMNEKFNEILELLNITKKE